MDERAGYDQPGDAYTKKNASFGVDAPPPYEPDPLPEQPGYPMQPGYDQQPGYGQQPYGQNTNTALVVTNQPQSGTMIIQPRTPNYMLSSIIACLCCFCPTGLCAIYYANEANTLAAAGDYVGAKRMSNNARNLMITTYIIGLIWITLVLVIRYFVYDNGGPYHY